MDTRPETSKIQTKLEFQIFVFQWIAWILVVLGAAAGAWGCYEFHCLGTGPTLNDLGSLGSYFQGAVGSLWALAGLMFIYVAFLGQRLQLSKQDDELEAQEAQFALQQESLRRQNFESAFFHLLNLQNKIATRMHQRTRARGVGGSGEPPEAHEEGRQLFEEWYNLFKDCYEQSAVSHGEQALSQINDLAKERQRVIGLYLTFFKNFQGDLGHYFRNLYHIFKFVDRSELLNSKDKKTEIENKRRYTSLARAQLSQYELALLFYNAITPMPPETANKFQRLIEKFSLLENFNPDLLIRKEHKKFYADSAFMDLTV